MHLDLQMARKLVDLFYPLVELTLFNTEGIVEEVLNPFSTLKEDQTCDFKDLGTLYNELLRVGRYVRCLVFDLNDRRGYLRLRYDLTYFKNLQNHLSFIIQGEANFPAQEDTEVWKESIDRTIAKYFTDNKINAAASTTKQKRELITSLQGKGLFDFKESSSYVASRLQISRATIYNYLKTAAHLKKVHIHQVDAFTSERFGGNPAGVVLDADELDESTMRKIARELNLSETAFILPSKKGTFQMRYFTPTGHEIKFCGHSTVGALYMIAKEERFGVVRMGNHKFLVETPCGILKMEASVDKEGGIQVAYETPSVKLKSLHISHEEVANAAGFERHLVDEFYPVMYEETNKDLFLVIRSLEDLKTIECDSKSFTKFSKQHEIVALCLFSKGSFDSKNHFHMRCFAPLVGIPEDPFTGSVLGGLTAYVDRFKLLPKEISNFNVEQGHFIERPGVVKVEFTKQKENYHVKVLAQAVHCFSTEINL